MALQKIFSGPKIEVSLERVVSSTDLQNAHKKYLSTNEPDSAFEIYPHRTQGLSVTAHRAEINYCIARLTIEGQSAGNLLWQSIEHSGIVSSSKRHLVPEEEEVLVVWRAYKKPEEEAFIFNTADNIHFDLHKVNKP